MSQSDIKQEIHSLIFLMFADCGKFLLYDKINKLMGDRSFSVAAACIWNSLPADVTSAPSLLVFRQMLKTERYRRSFPDN